MYICFSQDIVHVFFYRSVGYKKLLSDFHTVVAMLDQFHDIDLSGSQFVLFTDLFPDPDLARVWMRIAVQHRIQKPALEERA
jgi:hypothetical protein